MACTEMVVAPLLVCDFDGVLVNGMAEYWFAARRAALDLDATLQLPQVLPEAFRRLRPLIHKGWEMVLVAAELARADFHLPSWLEAYADQLPLALARRGWTADQLQAQLERVREQAIASDPRRWLGLHHFYPGVQERLRRLGDEGASWAVLTTKGGVFARQILRSAGLEPWAIYGHEQGSKPEVLARLLRDQVRPLWFLEDRRPTLEQVRRQPGLADVRCFLASWGYLLPSDGQDLPPGIHWLEPEAFAAPLARWP
jgi:phosphoglycolate phosphatase-like HAD superfamily hydrolase